MHFLLERSQKLGTVYQSCLKSLTKINIVNKWPICCHLWHWFKQQISYPLENPGGCDTGGRWPSILTPTLTRKQWWIRGKPQGVTISCWYLWNDKMKDEVMSRWPKRWAHLNQSTMKTNHSFIVICDTYYHVTYAIFYLFIFVVTVVI